MSNNLPPGSEPFYHHGALCLDVDPDADSLMPYVLKLLWAGGLDTQKVLLLPPERPRSSFLTELPQLGAFDIGPREDMLDALDEGHRQAHKDRR